MKLHISSHILAQLRCEPVPGAGTPALHGEPARPSNRITGMAVVVVRSPRHSEPEAPQLDAPLARPHFGPWWRSQRQFVWYLGRPFGSASGHRSVCALCADCSRPGGQAHTPARAVAWAEATASGAAHMPTQLSCAQSASHLCDTPPPACVALGQTVTVGMPWSLPSFLARAPPSGQRRNFSMRGLRLLRSCEPSQTVNLSGHSLDSLALLRGGVGARLAGSQGARWLHDRRSRQVGPPGFWVALAWAGTAHHG